MRLHEIIAANEKPDTTVLIEEIAKYKRSLLTLYGKEQGQYSITCKKDTKVMKRFLIDLSKKVNNFKFK